jgi:hypothetical protein
VVVGANLDNVRVDIVGRGAGGGSARACVDHEASLPHRVPAEVASISSANFRRPLPPGGMLAAGARGGDGDGRGKAAWGRGGVGRP